MDVSEISLSVHDGSLLLQWSITTIQHLTLWLIRQLIFPNPNCMFFNLFTFSELQHLQCAAASGPHFTRKHSEVAQLCPTLCNPLDCSLPGTSVHGIFQARVLEWVPIFFSRGSSWLRDRTQVSHIAGRHFNLWATREAQKEWKDCPVGSSEIWTRDPWFTRPVL